MCSHRKTCSSFSHIKVCPNATYCPSSFQPGLCWNVCAVYLGSELGRCTAGCGWVPEGGLRTLRICVWTVEPSVSQTGPASPWQAWRVIKYLVVLAEDKNYMYNGRWISKASGLFKGKNKILCCIQLNIMQMHIKITMKRLWKPNFNPLKSAWSSIIVFRPCHMSPGGPHFSYLSSSLSYILVFWGKSLEVRTVRTAFCLPGNARWLGIWDRPLGVEGTIGQPLVKFLFSCLRKLLCVTDWTVLKQSVHVTNLLSVLRTLYNLFAFIQTHFPLLLISVALYPKQWAQRKDKKTEVYFILDTGIFRLHWGTPDWHCHVNQVSCHKMD